MSRAFCEHNTLRPGTVVVTAFPGGSEAEGHCAACDLGDAGRVVQTTLGPHPGLTPTERALATEMLATPPGVFPHVTPLDVMLRHGLDEAEVHALLTGWDARGWVNYGVSLRTCWLEDEGRAALVEMLARTEGT